MESLPKHPLQAHVEVYSKSHCPACVSAKNLLIHKGVAFDLIDTTDNPEKQEEMYKRAAPRNTFPQVFVDGVCLGGFRDIKLLDDEAKLDPLLFPNKR